MNTRFAKSLVVLSLCVLGGIGCSTTPERNYDPSKPITLDNNPGHMCNSIEEKTGPKLSASDIRYFAARGLFLEI